MRRVKANFGMRRFEVWAAGSLAVLLAVGYASLPIAAQIRTQNANISTPTGSGSYIGIWLAEVNADRARELRLPEVAGVIVTLVSPGSPAEAAGLRPRDVIVEYDQKKIQGMEHFSRLVRETPAGRSVRLRVIRDGTAQMLTAKIGSIADSERPGPIENGAIQSPRLVPMQPQDVPRSLMTWRSPVLGVDAEPLFGQLAAYFGVQEGVLVRGVTVGMPAEKGGLKAGDVILRVGKNAVATPAEITAQLAMSASPTVKISIMRDHKELTIPVTLE